MSGHSDLGLGTAQWGLPYGISNQDGITNPETVSEILQVAQRHRVTLLDTASQYGEAEAILGTNSLSAFRVVSKTPRFATSVITDQQAVELVQTCYRSLEKLSCNKIYGLLVHHAEDLLVPGGYKLVDAMNQLKDEAVVQKIGVSIYDCEQVTSLLEILHPDIIQLPVSVLDQRVLLNDQLKRIKEKGIEVHARSIFLQGLMLMPINQIPSYFDPVRPLLARWHSAADIQGMSLTQAALSFVRDIPYIDTVLVGVESLTQFHACLRDFNIDANFDGTSLACNDPLFVNPSLWNL